MAVDSDTGWGRVLVIRVHADVLVSQPQPVDGLGDRVGQRHHPVTDASHTSAAVALAPASAVAGVHRDAVGLGMVPKEADRVGGDQLAQTRVRDAELQVAPARLALSAHKRKILGVLVEFAPVRRDNALVGVPAVQVEALHRTIALAPLTIGFVVVAPQAPVVPDAASIKGWTLTVLDGDLQLRNAGNHLPGLARKKLPVPETI